MMTAAKTKLVVASFACAALLAAGTWMALQAATAPAATTGAAAASSPATSPSVDFSTPKSTLRSFVAALNAGDKQKAYACLLTDPQHQTDEFDGCIAWALAQSRLLAAGKARFNVPANTLLGGIGIQIFQNLADLARQTITGDTATLTVPAETVDKLPVDSDERVWADQPIRFRKEGAAWKLDIDHSVAVRITLTAADELPPAQARARNVKVLMDLAALDDGIARQIEDKSLNSPLDVRVAIRSGAMEVFQKNGGDDMQAAFVPADGKARTP